MTRAAIYSRYSTDGQSDDSCEDQIAECRRYAEREGWTVVESAVVAEEGVSGASRHNRPGLLALVAEAGAAYDVLLAFDVSRLGRNDEDVAWVRNRLDDAGARCVEAASGDDLGSLSSRVRGILATEQREAIGVHTRRGLRGQFERGFVPGAAPYGYRLEAAADARDPNRKNKRLAVHEAEAAVVRRVFAEYVAGSGVKAIAHRLNAEGVAPPVPRGSPVVASWSPSSLGTILRNRIYVGELLWGRSRWRKVHGTARRRAKAVPEAEWLRRTDATLALVDTAVWEEAQVTRRRRQRGPRWGDGPGAPSPGRPRLVGRQPGRFMLSGLLVCGECGGAFGAQHREAWGCNAARQRGPTVCRASATVARAELEATVAAGLEALLDADALEAVAKIAEAEVARVVGDREAPARIEAEIARLETSMDALLALLVNDAMPADRVREQLAELEAKRRGLRRELEAARAAAPAPGAVAEALRRALGAVAAVLRGDPAVAREALRGLLGAEPLRLVFGADGVYRLVGALEVDTGCPADGSAAVAEPPAKGVAGAGFEPATCGL